MGVKVRKRRGTWWVFVSHQSRRKARKVGSREAAERVRREIEARLALGDFNLFSEDKVLTFAEYSDRWLRQHAEVQCKDSTVYSYRQLLRLYLLPRFGQARLIQITREQIKDFLAGLSHTGRFSRNTLRLMLCTIRVIFNHAIDDGIVNQNPASRLGRFTKSEKPKRQAAALTGEEVNRLLTAAREICPEYYPLLLMAVRTGLRRGELVALRWGDIQFGESEEDSNRYITVQNNYVHGKWTTTKSKRPRRVDLSRELRSVLLKMRDQRLLEAFTQGCSNIADDLVFPSQAGTVMDPDNMAKYFFLPCVEHAGLRRIRFHDLRHSFGSLLIQTGASLAYVKEQMGHSSIQVTVDTYGHLIPGGNIEWMDELDSNNACCRK